jgi:hypothetical protein
MEDPFNTVFSFGFRCKNNDNINLIFILWKIIKVIIIKLYWDTKLNFIILLKSSNGGIK